MHPLVVGYEPPNILWQYLIIFGAYLNAIFAIEVKIRVLINYTKYCSQCYLLFGVSQCFIFLQLIYFFTK